MNQYRALRRPTLFSCIGVVLILVFAVWNCNATNHATLKSKIIKLKDTLDSDQSDVWNNQPVHNQIFNDFLNKHSNDWWHAGNNENFSGMTIKDFIKRGSHKRWRRNESSLLNSKSLKPLNATIPTSYSLLTDYRYSSCKQLFYIRDLEQCGCWAFSVAEVVADRFCVSSKTRVNEILSPQYLISCDTNNGGCTYGYFDAAFSFVEKKGLVSESCFPFVSDDGTYIPPCPSKCVNSNPFKLLRVNNSRVFATNDIQGMQLSILTGGSLSASLDVYRDFAQYKGGVYRHIAGNYMFTHSVRILGWGITEQGVPYWICANNWTDMWGMAGYFWILRGNNECNIEYDVWETNPIL